MNDLLSVRVSTEESVRRIDVAGELDTLTAPRLREALAAPAGTDELICLDMGEVTFMDSTGIRLLLEAHAESRANGHSFQVVSPSKAVLRVLEAVGMTEGLPIVRR